MSEQHTPGPWHIKQGNACLHVVSANDAFHTGCISFDGRGTANAHLVSAAPDLLAACKKTVEENGHLADGDDCTLIDLKRAIAKAEGR